MDDRQTTGINADLGQNEDPYAGYGHDVQQEVDAGTPRVRSDIDFLNLPEGSDYLGPDNRRRTKHYTVTNDADFMRIPEGAPYIGPDGIPRDKPNYGDIGFTAQAMHDMAVTPEAKTEALRRSYGDKVKVDEAGPYIQEDDGTIRRPGVRSLKSALGTSVAETLPAIGMVGGGLLGGGLGGVVGTAAGPPGTVAGALAGGTGGAVGGAMAGRQANNVILSLLGIHQPVLDQLHSMGQEGLYTAGGEVVGRGVGKLAQYAKGPSKAGTGLPNDFTAGLSDAETPAATKTYATRKQQIAQDLGGVLESMGITPEKGPFIGITRKGKGSDVIPNDFTRGLEDIPAPPGTKMPDSSLDNPKGAFGSYVEPEVKKHGYPTPGAREFLGVNDEGLERIASAQKSGFKPAPSVAFPEAPMLTKIEQFDAAFNPDASGQGRFGQSLREGYNRIGENIITAPEIKGVVKEPLTSSTEAVSYKEAGEKAVVSARIKMALEDINLEASIAEGPERWAQTYIDNVGAARNMVKTGIDQLRLDADVAMQNIATGSRPVFPGHLVNDIAASFKSYGTAVRARASGYYTEWDRVAGAKPVDVTGLQADAERFFDAMPDGLAGKYPLEVRLLNKLVAPEGEEAITMTAGELHHLRSWMRHGIDYDDLASDMSQGAMKHFEGKVNRVIQALPDSDLLNKADAFYKDTIPYLNNEMIRATMKAIKGGTGIDPEVAANIFFKAGRAEDVREARKVLGPNLWNAIEAAHVQSLVNKSKDFNGVDAGKFSDYILSDHRAGMLNLGYSESKMKELLHIGEEIQKLDGKIYIDALPTDSIPMILNKARAKALEDARVAAIDPLKAFDEAAKKMRSDAALHRKSGPLSALFGTDMSFKGEQAARNILSNEDRIIAASNYLDKATFDSLRQVFVRDFLQREFKAVGGMRKELSANPLMTERVQALMFPGNTLDQLKTLAKNAEFLSGAVSIGNGEMSGGLAAGAQVMNPSRHVPGMKKFSKIPGVDFVNRIILGKVYGALMEGVSHPSFAAWLTKSLESGNPAQRLAARNVLNDRLKTSPWIGRALGQESVPSAPDQTQDQYAQ
jgi:hypothetical protein